MTLYIVRPHSEQRIMLARTTNPIVIENPTDHAIAVTVEAGYAVADWGQGEFGRRFETAAQNQQAIGCPAFVPPPPMEPGMLEMLDWQGQRVAQAAGVPPEVRALRPPETAEEVVRRQEIAMLEQQMRQRNAERVLLEGARNWGAYRRELAAWRVNGVGLTAEGAAATERSLKFLREHLTPEQQTTWDNSQYFDVKGNVSGAIYRLGPSGVTRRSDLHDFCLQIVGEWTPIYDAVLARKILLECDEKRFLATANDLSGPPPYPVPPWESAVDRTRRLLEEVRQMEAEIQQRSSGVLQRTVQRFMGR